MKREYTSENGWNRRNSGIKEAARYHTGRPPYPAAIYGKMPPYPSDTHPYGKKSVHRRSIQGVLWFRYVQIEGNPEIKPENFTAIAVYSDMEQTGSFACSSPFFPFTLNSRYPAIFCPKSSILAPLSLLRSTGLKRLCTPKQEILFYASGKEDYYKTAFAVFGFRYVQIEGNPEIKPENLIFCPKSSILAPLSLLRSTGLKRSFSRTGTLSEAARSGPFFPTR